MSHAFEATGLKTHSAHTTCKLRILIIKSFSLSFRYFLSLYVAGDVYVRIKIYDASSWNFQRKQLCMLVSGKNPWWHPCEWIKRTYDPWFEQYV